MSMSRTQEYFGPLRSRQISLQQWERGLLFESTSHQGGKRKSKDLESKMALQTDHDELPSNKIFRRRPSLSTSSEGENGSELSAGAPPESQARVFSRRWTFSSSFHKSGEVLPEVGSSSSTSGKSNAYRPQFQSPRKEFFFSRSFGRGHAGSEISKSVGPEYLATNHPRESRYKKFLSGALSFSKSLGKGESVQSCDAQQVSIPSSPVPSFSVLEHKTAADSDTNHGSHLVKKFFARVWSLSRTFDSRGEIRSEVIDDIPYNKDTEIQRKFLGRGLSFSRSLDRNGEPPLEACSTTGSPVKSPVPWQKRVFQRGLSFSRSLVATEGTPSQKAYDIGRSSELDEGTETRARKFSRYKDGNREPPLDVCTGSSSSETSDSVESGRSKIAFRGFPFFRHWRLSGEISSMISGTGRSSNKDNMIWSKTFFARGSSKLSFSRSAFSRSVDANGDSSAEVCGSSGCEKEKEFHFKNLLRRLSPLRFSGPRGELAAEVPDTSRYPINGSPENLPRKFFSRDWPIYKYWSRSASLSSAQVNISAPVNVEQPLSEHAIVSDSIPTSSAPVNSHPSGLTNPGSGASLRKSRALKHFWPGRSQSSNTTSTGNDQNSKLVLLEKVPADDQESDDLAVYVGERGGKLTKYVLSKTILRHHLFQVLLKCSQDELGSDHDYNSGVPIICDPALFLQVARVVGGNFLPAEQLIVEQVPRFQAN